MGYDILVQPQSKGEYRATILGWPDLVATGQSEQAALEQVKMALRIQLSRSKIVHVSEDEVDTDKHHAEHPWQQFLGMWKEDETFDDFVEQMAIYRQAQGQG